MTSQTATAVSAPEQQPNPTRQRRRVLTALYAGCAMTIIATSVPYVDRATSNALAAHIRAGYPSYSRAHVETAANTYLAYLSVVGVLGVAGWLWAARAVRTGKRWARGGATALFVMGASVAVFDLLVKDTSGAAGLAPLLGWVGVLPSVPGLMAVTLLWRDRGPRRPETPFEHPDRARQERQT